MSDGMNDQTGENDMPEGRSDAHEPTPAPETTVEPPPAAPRPGAEPPQGPSGSRPDEAQEAPPAKRRGRGCATGCGFAVVGMLSAVIGGLVISLLVPTLLGVDVVKMLAGGYLGSGGGPVRYSSERVNIVSEPTTAQPVVAVAAKVTPSVVHLSTRATQFSPFGGQQISGAGSGVIMSADGYVVTNDHVVRGTDRIFVTTQAERNIEAKVVGRDPESDIAVIKIERNGLVPAEFGDSDKLRVGEGVVALGSPFGLEQSVTYGIVSAIHRRENSGSSGSIYADLIQTDAAINPGNSGGALADMSGRVVGINTLIEAPSGQFGAPQSAGVGFAIPSSYARKIADQLVKTGKASHPYLGIVSQSLTRDISQQRGLSVSEGALILDVPAGGPAAGAGVRAGDVLVRIADTQVKEVADIFAALRRFSVGDTVELKVVRDGKRTTIKVKLAEKPKALLPPG